MRDFFEETDVSLPDQIIRRIGEHEILLSFNDDVQAYAFSDWWYSVGIKKFKKWTDNKKNIEEYC